MRKIQFLYQATNTIRLLLSIECPSTTHESAYGRPQRGQVIQQLTQVHKADETLANASPQKRLSFSPFFIQSAPQSLEHILHNGSHLGHPENVFMGTANTLQKRRLTKFANDDELTTIATIVT